MYVGGIIKIRVFMKKINKILSFKLFFGIGFLVFNGSFYAKNLTEIEVVESCKTEIVQYSKYAQNIDMKSLKHGDKEILIESVLKNLNIKLNTINDGFDKELYKTLRTDIRFLKNMMKEVSRYKHNQDALALKNNIQNYLSNIDKISMLFRRNTFYIKGYSIMNYYKSMPTELKSLLNWAHKNNSQSSYPLYSYVYKVYEDFRWIRSIKKNNQYKKLILLLEGIDSVLTITTNEIMKTTEFKIDQMIMNQMSPHYYTTTSYVYMPCYRY